MLVSERIKYLSEHLDKSKEAFYDKINVSRQTITAMIARNGDPGYKTIKGILTAYPKVNPYWLILGEEEPFLNSPKLSQFNEDKIDYKSSPLIDISQLTAEINALKARIEKLENQ